ncbi:MAG: hypothetical protein ABFQ62_03895 [Patescibacteria group bacterium]
MNEKRKAPEQLQEYFFYRGDFGLKTPILQSDVNLVKFSGNPHSREFQNQLLWLTPLKNYAERVAVARAIAQLLISPNIDPELFSRVSLTEYKVGRQTQIYSSTKEYLMPISGDEELPSQVIIQGVGVENVRFMILEEDSIKKLVDLLNQSIPKDKLKNFLGRVNMRLMANIYPPQGNESLTMLEYIKKFTEQILASMGGYIERVHKTDPRAYVLDIVAESVFIYLLNDIDLQWKEVK